ncbi:DUF221-domain-containing protein [Punctularia strigosozonata HHB-11173 SS5]|uniref:DUF221-domain-containing protein n=1 Tax=Punctularia strigosozonata (strain HHB-11173) TaxID=741275 RepID=UPI00044171F9|nr:DUF221-domain-containing protein [Punctularia strigosozonata HHB-11173 SS5]EIN09034.1 DUF221-domain-containing protein [Punctularia strigosozonata HHB-11173 SS5]
MSATSKDTSTATTPSFLSALVVGVVVFAVYMIAFFLLHGRYRHIYQPRTLLAPVSKRPPELPPGFFAWFGAIARAPDILVFDMNGPDAYFFVRFIRLMCLILLPVWILTWAVLMPVTATKPNGGLTQLNIFTFGNVQKNHQIKHLAHLLVSVVVILYILFMIYREYKHFVIVRQEYLSSPAHGRLARSRTVMLNNLPASLLSADAIRSIVPTPITHVWLPRKTKALDKLFDERDDECARLESAEGSLLSTAAKNVRKNKVPTTDAVDPEKAGGVVERYVAPKQMPTHKTGLPVLKMLVGKKHRTLETSPAYVRERNERITEERQAYRAAVRTGDGTTFALVNSAFVRFERMEDAHAFARDVKAMAGSKLVGAAVEVVPEDIIWSNLAMSPVMRKVRTGVSWALTIGLIIIWAIPVAVVGVISNVNYLCSEVSFLSWICKLPKVVVGIIQGVLPPVLLAVLFMLLPIVLRILVRLQGEPRRSDVERKLFSRFWLFQVVHGFLIITFASGLPAALKNISKTTSGLPTQLAQQLPGASIFFLTFVITTMLSTAGGTNARVVPLVMANVKKILGASTPRGVWKMEWGMGALPLATVWPPVALLGCICIVYSIIQPVVVGFGAVGFVLYVPLFSLSFLCRVADGGVFFRIYITYKYLAMYVVDQPDALETGGLYYPRALRTVFVSLYLLEVCLTGLYFLNTNGGKSVMALVGGSVTAALIVFTAVVQIWMERRRFAPARYVFLDTGAHLLKTGSAEGLNPAVGAPLPPSAAAAKNKNNAGKEPRAEEEGEEEEEDVVAGPQYGNTTGMHGAAFDPPSTWKAQRVVWVADDALGLGRAEVERLRREGVAASCEWASMDERGQVSVERGPPDEAWYGGMTAA